MTQIEKRPQTLKNFFQRDLVKDKLKEILDKRSTSFITTVLQICNQNDLLSQATPESVFGAAMTSATLDLPINPNLGFAYIVPYKTKNGNSYENVAQFQIGYKGLIQLAQRSGQIKTISATPIYEGQIVSSNPLTGYIFDFEKKESSTIIGYAAYFSLLNGFEKTQYMTIDEIEKHAKRYSQTFKRDFGVWKDNFHSMAMKTVLKLILSKFAPLSVDMQKAIQLDQTVIEDKEFEYVDNKEDVQEAVEVKKEEMRGKETEQGQMDMP